ncbi:MAG: hypothetical protein LBD37_02755, partial [Treponema sp.]|nr:hypothetical protein [Treponema sp.]
MKLNKTRTLAGSMAAAVFLAALALVLLVAGCELNAPTDVRQVAPVAAEDTSLTRHDYLALLKTQVNHKVSQDELRKIVSGALETTP